MLLFCSDLYVRRGWVFGVTIIFSVESSDIYHSHSNDNDLIAMRGLAGVFLVC